MTKARTRHSRHLVTPAQVLRAMSLAVAFTTILLCMLREAPAGIAMTPAHQTFELR